jgi:hypothetical protein
MIKKSGISVLAEFRLSVLVGLTALALMFFSCSGDGNGDGDSSSSVTILSSSDVFSSSSDAFVCPIPATDGGCVGTGSDTARLFIQWNDGGTPDPMVWIYRFNPPPPNDSVTGIDMIYAVAKEDSRFAVLVYITDSTDVDSLGRPLGVAVGGFGYFPDGVRELDSSSTPVFADSNGLFIASSYNSFDDYEKPLEPEDNRWASGWFTGYWSYENAENYTSNTLNTSSFTWGGLGASSRKLVNNSADYWEWILLTPPSSSEETSASAKINFDVMNHDIRRKP